MTSQYNNNQWFFISIVIHTFCGTKPVTFWWQFWFFAEFACIVQCTLEQNMTATWRQTLYNIFVLVFIFRNSLKWLSLRHFTFINAFFPLNGKLILFINSNNNNLSNQKYNPNIKKSLASNERWTYPLLCICFVQTCIRHRGRHIFRLISNFYHK